MNETQKELVSKLFLIAIVSCVIGFVGGFAVGNRLENSLWKKILVEMGHAEYQANPTTGETRFLIKKAEK